MNQNKPLVDAPCSFNLLVPQLHLYVGKPGLFLWLPLHPALKDLPRSSHVPQHLLHVRILEPELIGAGENGHCTVPDVPCMVNLLVSHFHFSIFEPDGEVAMFRVECSLVHRACPGVLLLALLPLSVLQPVARDGPVLSDVVLELFPLSHLVLLQLVLVRDPLLRRSWDLLQLAVVRLPQELLRRDLHLGGKLALHLGRFGQLHLFGRRTVRHLVCGNSTSGNMKTIAVNQGLVARSLIRLSTNLSNTRATVSECRLREVLQAAGDKFYPLSDTNCAMIGRRARD